MPDEIARPELRDRREHAPGQRRFLGDAEIETDLADGRDIEVVGPAVGAQHAAEIGHGADDEADAGAAAAFQHADLHSFACCALVPTTDADKATSDTGKDE